MCFNQGFNKLSHIISYRWIVIPFFIGSSQMFSVALNVHLYMQNLQHSMIPVWLLFCLWRSTMSNNRQTCNAQLNIPLDDCFVNRARFPHHNMAKWLMTSTIRPRCLEYPLWAAWHEDNATAYFALPLDTSSDRRFSGFRPMWSMLCSSRVDLLKYAGGSLF